MSISPSIVNSCRHCTARCCRGLAVVLTIPEAKRMVAELGLPPEDFLEFSSSIDSKETPHYPLLVKKGPQLLEYFIILKRRRVNCIFLQDDLRCGIYASRPYVCKLYPFELDGRKQKKGALCPVRFEKEEGTEKDAEFLRHDLIEHGKIARQWNAKYGREIPEIRKFDEYFQTTSSQVG